MPLPSASPTFADASQVVGGEKIEHITLFQDALKFAFAQRILSAKEITPNTKEYFEKIEAAKKLPSLAEVDMALEAIYSEENFDKKTLAEVLEIDAKSQDILRRARKSATDNIVGEYKKNHFDQSNSLASELAKCAETKMPETEVQKYLNKYFRAVFSLTGHPTNTSSVEYTAIGYELDEVLASTSNADEAALFAVLDRVIATPLYGAKKSPIEEMEETNLALRKIQETQSEIRQRLQKVITKSSYPNLELPKTIFEVSAWTHGGDADGNPNITAEVLEAGYKSLEQNNFDATIDIRHDAGDLMDAVDGILKKNGVTDFLKKSPQEQADLLAQLLKDQTQIENLSKLTPDEKSSAEIVKRLRICAAHLGRTEKLIIANTTGANNALAALLLLKVTGNKVAEEGAKIDIVTLSESIKDLQGIHEVQKSLLANETYRKHLESRGRIQQMIAKSDTFRVGGPGAEFWQDVAAAEAYLLGKIARDEYGLELDIRVFNGGGAALQRGGGRPEEAANRQAKALLYIAQKYKIPLGELKKDVTSLTIQGHQQQLFCAKSVIYNAMESLMSQNLHSALLAEEKLPSKENPQSEEVRGEFCNAAVEAYQSKYFANKNLNELFANSNRVGVALGNLSSRPAKRGAGSVDIAPGITFDQLSGSREGFDLFGTRAITLDRTLAHSGTFAVMFLGLREAFEKKSPQEMREIYKENKGFRDFIRNQITVLYMVDLEHSWGMMIGEKRPSNEEIKLLASQFENEEISDPKQRQKITMAYLDLYIHDVARAICKTLSNQKDSEDLELKTLLREYSPELELEMRYREREARFAKMVEENFVAQGNLNGDKTIDGNDLRIINACYRGADIASNAPVSMQAILTSQRGKVSEREFESDLVPEFSNSEHSHHSVSVANLIDGIEEKSLKVPTCLTAIAQKFASPDQQRTH
jgi:hypothetical protein